MNTGQFKAMKEKRQLERFSIRVPARIEAVISAGRRETLDLSTSNISSGGAFFCTRQALPRGAQVKMDLTVPLNSLEKHVDCSAVNVRVNGIVVRSSLSGMAIRFEDNYHMMPTQRRATLK